jgi:excinuclease UvrABC helicase subunit UvrB
MDSPFILEAPFRPTGDQLKAIAFDIINIRYNKQGS